MSDLFQSVPFAVVLLIIGFVFLVKGADAFGYRVGIVWDTG